MRFSSRLLRGRKPCRVCSTCAVSSRKPLRFEPLEHRHLLSLLGPDAQTVGAQTVGAQPAGVGSALYVDADAPGDQTGLSWFDAFDDLQAALAVAADGDEIRVAEGIYRPAGSVSGDRGATFRLVAGVTVEGGYAGFGEVDPDARDVAAFETILSGDLKGDDGPNFTGNDENSYHVVIAEARRISLDGFTITGGNANETSYGESNAYGGGMYCGIDPVLNDVTFSGNFATYGGGMYCGPSGAVETPTLTGCTFIGNAAGLEGGGLWIGDSDPTLIGCKILENTSAGDGGGVAFGNDNVAELVNCIVSGNTAAEDGGGLHAVFCFDTALINTAVVANTAGNRGGGLFCEYDCHIVIENSIFWGNQDPREFEESAQIAFEPGEELIINNSCIQGWTGSLGGSGNFGDDPQFVDLLGADGTPGTADDDLRLAAGSPSIDAGNNAALPPTVVVDLDGNPRIAGGSVDMGPYEFVPPLPRMLYVDDDAPHDPGPGSPHLSDPLEDGSEVHPFDSIQEAIDLAADGDTVLVRAGEYGIGRSIRFLGKAIEVRGESGPEQTTVRMYLSRSNVGRASVVVFDGGETEASVLEGFTLTGGAGTRFGLEQPPFAKGGGIIFWGGSSATINDCMIVDNKADYGGGIYCGEDSSPRFENTTIADNTAIVSGGGGLYCERNSSPTLIDCTIAANQAAGSGGGAFFGHENYPVLSGCTISDNTAEWYGGGIGMDENGYPTLIDCTVAGNTAIRGGGMSVDYDGEPVLAGCTFRENTATEVGGAVYAWGHSALSFENCTISGNEADRGGGLAFHNADATLINCLVSGNNDGGIDAMMAVLTLTNSTFGGNAGVGFYGDDDTYPTLTNCIFWGNGDGTDQASQLDLYQPQVTIDNSCVQGWTGEYGGSGNFGDNPRLFDPAGGNYRLAPGSPCIDAGDNAAVPTLVTADLDGNARFVDDPATPDTGGGEPPIVDVGAFEFQSPRFVYVDRDAAGGDDGSSWADAYNDLQDALAIAVAGDRILVAEGVYTPVASGGSRHAVFALVDGVAIVGGYAGFGEANPNARDVAAYETILSGDLDADDVPVDRAKDLLGHPTRDDNVYHVVAAVDCGVNTSLSGLTIGGGNAAGSESIDRYGGGIYLSHSGPVLSELTIVGNVAVNGGGGIYDRFGTTQYSDCTISGNAAGSWAGGVSLRGWTSSDTTLDDCLIENNYAGISGGGIATGNATLNRCIVTGNHSDRDAGGVDAGDGAPTLEDCVISENTAAASGGGFEVLDGYPTLIDCLLENNSATEGGAVALEDTQAVLIGCRLIGNTARDGGGIYANQSYPTISECTFLENRAGDHGGAVYLGGGGNATLADCTFDGNRAFAGGGIEIQDSDPTITGCTFTENTSEEYGAAIDVHRSSPLLVGCTFLGNVANDFGGGAICNWSSSPTVIGCLFSGNVSPEEGGAIMSNQSSLSLADCTFAGNTAGVGGSSLGFYAYLGHPSSDMQAANCIFWDPDDVIWKNDETAVTITHSVVRGGWPGEGNLMAYPRFVDADGLDNVAGTADDDLRLQSDSPCIDAGDNTAVPDALTVDLGGNARFVNDPDTPDTGRGTPPIVDIGVYEWQGPRVVYVDADADGGDTGRSWADAFTDLQDALAAAVTDATVEEIRVAEGVYTPAAPGGDRSATFQLVDGVVLAGGYAGFGRLSPDARNVDTYATILSGDLAGDDGPDFAGNEENSFHVVTGSGTSDTAVFDGFTITAGNADSYEEFDHVGAGMFNDRGSPTVIDCTFAANYVGDDDGGSSGGGMYNLYAAPTLVGCSFVGNYSLALDGGEGHGGAIRNLYSDPVITGCSFIDNYSGQHGGAMHNYDSNPVLTDCTFTGNSATKEGGGSRGGAIYNSDSSPVITDCTFTENFVSAGSNTGGGAIYFTGDSQPVLTRCNFVGNYATGTREIGKGGAIHGDRAEMTIAECTFAENSAWHGGAVYSYGSDALLLEDCTLADNTANYGGGVYSFAEAVELTACTFQRNEAEYGGGGLYGDDARLSLTDCTFLANRGLDYHDAPGGAVRVDGGTATLLGCEFLGNSASYGGGLSAGGITTAVNCTFSGNTVHEGGGAVTAGNGTTLINCTVVGNSCDWFDAGGIDGGAGVRVVNSIVWGNSLIDDFSESAQIGGNVAVSYSCVEGWTGQLGGEGNFSDDPLMADADGPDDVYGTIDDDLRPTAGSPAIDAGDDAAVPPDVGVDRSGNPRIVGPAVDVGAYEFQGRRWLVVDDNAPGDPGPDDPNVSDPLEDGSEEHPFDTIMEAIDAAVAGEGVRVAAGVYREPVVMKDGVDLQGAGADVTVIDERNAHAVVRGASHCRLAGFTVTGHAQDDIDGVYCQDVQGMLIADNIIRDNTWSGIDATRSSLVVVNNVIVDNRCGGVVLRGAADEETRIVNNTIGGNGNEAGVSVWHGAAAAVTNNVVVGNRSGGVACIEGGVVTLAHNNLWDNDYIDCQPGPTDISARPQFVDPANDDYRLLPGSPCIDAGDNAALPASVTVDLDANARFVDDPATEDTGAGTPPIVDLGAYEWQGPDVIYVDVDAAGENDGSTWADAYRDLQDALAVAVAGDVIRVAQGVYTPAEAGGGREATFQLQSGVTVVGGYAGFGEASPDARNVAALETVLSGDLMGNDEPISGIDNVSRHDNAFHVVTGNGTDATAVLDGVTITAGHANGGWGDGTAYGDRGGGMYNQNASPTLIACTFFDNRAFSEEGGIGGGMYNQNASPTLVDCTFVQNRVDTAIRDHGAGNGAGIAQSGGNLTLVGCTFSRNTAEGNDGGAISHYGGALTLTDCTFTNNSANGHRGSGGAVYKGSGDLVVAGCTFEANRANAGGAIYTGGAATLTDSTFIHNGGIGSHGRGGAIFARHGDVEATRCAFVGNGAVSSGGAIYNWSEVIELDNCAFDGNVAPAGAAVYNAVPTQLLMANCTLVASSHGAAITFDSSGEPSTATVRNSILWNEDGEIQDNDDSTITVTYSDVRGGFLGEGNLDVDPMLIDVDGMDDVPGSDDDLLQLRPGSPCIDAGDNASAPATAFDLDGLPRFVDDPFTADTGSGTSPIVDMGAYEYAGDPAPPSRLFVDADAAEDGNGTSWIDAFTDLQAALDAAYLSGTVDEIWVAAGTYLPTVRSMPDDPRSATFQMVKEVALLGGFAGGETSLAQRAPAANETVLSGDLHGDDAPQTAADHASRNDNAYHVVTGMNTDATAVLDGFTITAGNATNGSGGGMYNDSWGPTVTNCVFRGNAAEYGGAMVPGYSIVTNCTFTGNAAVGDYGDGGAVYNLEYYPTFINCTFTGNTAPIHPGGYVAAGGIASQEGTTTLTNSILWGNAGTQAYGADVTYSNVEGGIEGVGNLDADPLFADADGPDDVFGTADDDLRLLPGSPSVDVGDNAAVPSWLVTDLAGNPRIAGGTVDMGAYESLPTLGVLYVDDDAPHDPGPGDPQLSDPLEDGSPAHPFDSIQEAIDLAADGHIVLVRAGEYGIAEPLSFLGKAIEVRAPSGPEQTTVRMSPTPTDPGQASVVIFDGKGETSVLDGFTLTGGTGSRFGPEGPPLTKGGGILFGGGSSATVSNCVIVGNLAERGGGVYCDEESSARLENCTIAENSTIFSGGGGLYVARYASATLIDCTITGNDAVGNGGGVFLHEETFPAFSGCTITGNTSALRGGGLFLNESAYPTLTDCTIANNTATRGGGMLVDCEGEPVLVNCTFLENAATEFGGAVYAWCGAAPSFENCTIQANTARSGGGIYSEEGSLTLSECTLSENRAEDHGGGLYLTGGVDATLTGCTFSNSRAFAGGAIEIRDSNPTITGCTFVENASEEYGAAINVWRSDPLLVGCTFLANVASDFGGGAICNWSSSPVVIGCLFSGNVSAEEGGAIMNNQSSPTLTNCTFAGNTAGVGGSSLGFYAYRNDPPSSLQATNCILWEADDVIWKNEETAISITHSNVRGGWPGEGNLDVDPRFVDANGPDDVVGTADDDLRLLPGSPAIDAGDNAAVPSWLLVDIDGHSRIVADTVDLGPYESQATAGSIRGSKFHDLDGDGVWDDTEPGLEGWTIFLDDDLDGRLSPGELVTVTGADGSYAFENLDPRDYRVREVARDGWQQTLPAPGFGQRTERVSRAWDELNVEEDLLMPSISADGRYVAFDSEWNTSDVVPADTNDHSDIFVYDRQTGSTQRVSLAYDGAEANGGSRYPSISADGRYVAFESLANNLMPGPGGGFGNVYVYDRHTETLECVSRAPDGSPADNRSEDVRLSADGRYVAFWSAATNLVADSPDTSGIFVHDRQTGITECVSLASDGTPTNDHCYYPAIGADGRFVAFRSQSTNLVPGDTSPSDDVFVYDRQTDVIERVSVAPDGSPGNGVSSKPSISADGRYVVFSSDATNLVPGDTNETRDIFLRDRQTGAVERISVAADGTQANDYSGVPQITPDGRYVAFHSRATNLVPGDTNDEWDVFVYDRHTESTRLVSLADDGSQGDDSSAWCSISPDGKYVAFRTRATNMTPDDANGHDDVFVRDLDFTLPGTHTVVVGQGQTVGHVDFGNLQLGGEIRGSAFNDLDGDGVWDDAEPGIEGWTIFLDDDGDGGLSPGELVTVSGADGGYAFEDLEPRDYRVREVPREDWQQTAPNPNGIEIVSLARDGSLGSSSPWSPAISAEGHHVAFASPGANLVPEDDPATREWDIFVRDRRTGSLERVSVAPDGTDANDDSLVPALSADGRYVVFYSDASNLVAGDTNGQRDMFVYDRLTDDVERIDVPSEGKHPDRESVSPTLSADGRYVVFASYAPGIVPEDTDEMRDVFVYDRQSGGVEWISAAFDGSQGDGECRYPSISGDGRLVAFESSSTNLVPDDTNGDHDVFVFDRQTRTTRRVSVTSDGAQAVGHSIMPSIGTGGRYVTFSSAAVNLVAGDSNEQWDVFVHDLESGTTERVSLASDGSQGNGYSRHPAIGGDGRFVTFQSDADNLVPGDTNDDWDVFVYDRQTETVRRVNVGLDGSDPDDVTGPPSITADGRAVIFKSYANNLVAGESNDRANIFVATDPEVVPPGSYLVALAPGEMLEGLDFGNRFNVVPGQSEIRGNSFHDLDGDGTRDDGEPGLEGWTVVLDNVLTAAPPLTAVTDPSGEYAFTDLVPGTYTVTETPQPGWVQTAPQTPPIGVETVSFAFDGSSAAGRSSQPSISADGRYVVFKSHAQLVPEDTDHTLDIYLHDRQTGTIERVSTTFDGAPGTDSIHHGTISPDGRYVAFASDAWNIVPGDENGASDVFLRDLATGVTEIVSLTSDGRQSDRESHGPELSADGRFVAFWSYATNLVPGDSNGTADIFVRDRQTGTAQRVNVASDGTQADAFSRNASISADGRYVAFYSEASNLVPGDTNERPDVFVYDRQTATTQRVSVASDGSQGDRGSGSWLAMSADGRCVAFQSDATNFAPGDTAGHRDVFVYDRQTETVQRVSVATGGTQANADCYLPAISGDGRFVSFYSGATNLVPGDTNGEDDVFVFDRQTGIMQRANVALDGSQGNGAGFYSALSGDGRFLAFQSFADNLTPGDTNHESDVFVTELGPFGTHTVVLGAAETVEDVDFGNRRIVGPLDGFEFTTIDSPQRADAPFSVTVTAVDAEGYTKTDFDGFVDLSGWTGNGIAPTVVISEIRAGSPDAVEFTNVSDTAVDLSGWQVLLYDRPSGNDPLPALTLPPGSICTPGGVFLVEQRGDAPGVYPHFYTGDNISWRADEGGVGVLLLGADGEAVDFVAASELDPADVAAPIDVLPDCWQGDPVVSLPDESVTYQRIGDVDLDDASDWVIGVPSMGTVNRGLTLPFASTSMPVAVMPRRISLAGGTWTGEVSVPQAADEMVLRADDGSGHAGLSNTFAVDELAVDRFLVSPVYSAQVVDVPFDVTITAVDAAGNVMTDFQGPLQLRGVGPDAGVSFGGSDYIDTWSRLVDASRQQSRVQTIVSGGSLFGRSPITGLSLDVAELPGDTLHDFTIRIKHTTLSEYTEPALQTGGWTTVYRGDATLDAVGWVEFAFSRPFEHNGTDNLLIDFSFNNSHESTDGEIMWDFMDGPNRTIYARADGDFGDPLDWSPGNAPPLAVTDAFPCMRLTMGEGVEITPQQTGPLVDGTWTGQITVHEAINAMFIMVDDGQGRYSAGNRFDVRFADVLGEIRGSQFSDLDGDGLRDPGEPALAGWTAYLDENANGRRDATERSTVTDAEGNYTLRSVVDGTHLVAVETPDGWQQTLPDPAVPNVRRVSVAADGTQGHGEAGRAAVSAEGRYVAFASEAANLVPGDTNDCEDVFVCDVQTGAVERVSVASDGTQGNRRSFQPAISADGRYVAFVSSANNFAPDDTNWHWDVFVHDRQTDVTQRVSVTSDGSEANDYSESIAISPDGSSVAFRSGATNLVAGVTNGESQLYVYDLRTQSIECASVAPDGSQGDSFSSTPSLSADGRLVAFRSYASNLVPGDTNDKEDVFVFDRQTQTARRVSVASDGTQADDRSYEPAISGDGRYVAFESEATNLVSPAAASPLYVYDLQTGTVESLDLSFDDSVPDVSDSSISGDGRYVAFASHSSSLVGGDTNRDNDVFVYDRHEQRTQRLSLSVDGSQIDDAGRRPFPVIAPDGHSVVFISDAAGFVPGDTNGLTDVFLAPISGAASMGRQIVSLSPGQIVDGVEFGVRREAPWGEVVGRHVFYGNSAFDDPQAGLGDDDAIAPDKTALLPGQAATAANYTNYNRGINGVMIDVAGWAKSAEFDDGVLESDVWTDLFGFRTGNVDQRSQWASAPSPEAVTLRRGAGADGSDRFTITWPDYAVAKQWLEVTVAAAPFELSTDDVFYFGNAVADAGNGDADAMVTATDLLLARNNPRNFLNPAEIDLPYDYNRDQRVNTTDVLLARNNQTNFLTAFRMLDLSDVGQGGAEEPETELAKEAVDALLEVPI